MPVDMKSLELTENFQLFYNWWISTWPTQWRVIYVTNLGPPAPDPPQKVSVTETMMHHI